MSEVQRVVFRGERGLTGFVDPGLPAIGGMTEPHTYVYLDDGQQIPVPVSRLRADTDGGYSLITIDEQPAVVAETVAADVPATPIQNPLDGAVERVRVTKTVEEQQHLVNEPVLREDVVVERVQIGTMVDAVPPSREENGTFIFPVVEEVLVVEKRYLLKEEVRVTRTSQVKPEERVFTTRTEHAAIEPTTDSATATVLPGAFEPASVVVGPDGDSV